MKAILRPTRGTGLLENFLARKRVRRADSLIPAKCRHGRILDIGCGVFPYFLRNTRFSAKYAIDRHISSETADFHFSGINAIRLDVETEPRLPFEEDFFDVVTMLAVLEHVGPERAVTIMSEIHRIMKKDGLLIMTTPNFRTGGILKFLAMLNMVSSSEIGEHKASYCKADISDLLTNAGFSGENIQSGCFELFMNIWVRAAK